MGPICKGSVMTASVRTCRGASFMAVSYLWEVCTKSAELFSCETNSGIFFRTLAAFCPQVVKLSLYACDAPANTEFVQTARDTPHGFSQLSFHFVIEVYDGIFFLLKRCSWPTALRPWQQRS